MTRRYVFTILAGLAAFGAVAAAAASLGGITSSDLGADTTVVASCDTDGVGISHSTAYDASDKRYEVNGVTITGIAEACDGQLLSVTLADSAGTSLGTGTTTVTGTSQPVTITPNADAEAVENAAIVISS